MQAPSRLRVGLHIEHARTLALVQAMLAQAGHRYLLDSPGVHSLAAYLGIVLDQMRQAASSPYDVLIVGGVEADALTDTPVLLALEHLFAVKPIPILVITDASRGQLRTWQTFPRVALLPESDLSIHFFFQALGRLTGTVSGIPNPLFEHLSPDAVERSAAMMERYEQLVEEERSRIAVRHQWLEQRQAWLEAREQAPDPQQEWLAEQGAWLEQQRSEVEDQQRNVTDLRSWLRRYQQRIDEEHPGPQRSAQ
jgi:hypothetical protein